uniref:Uncharacterized protein n=1 Tax=Mustela putorius furo TaxID=9669 RepID=M3YED6_MUSPF
MRTLSPDLRLRFKGNRAWPGLPGFPTTSRIRKTLTSPSGPIRLAGTRPAGPSRTHAHAHPRVLP